jgi:glycerol kinase
MTTSGRELLLAIDQGTSSTRAIAFDLQLKQVASASRPIVPVHPRPGWVEYDAKALLSSVVDVVADVMAEVGGPGRIAAAGLDNQGETVVAWDAERLEPLAPAISWQCRRSQAIVDRFAGAGHGPAVRAATGLPLDPYYSASKLSWLLENTDSVRRARERGNLRLGTVDAWLTAVLGGASRTDPSTASRTQLVSLASRDWDPDLLALFDVRPAELPLLGPTAGLLGELTHPAWGGRVALTAMACDQQAALAGHGGFEEGALKATYGTGVFVLANAGMVHPLVDGIETSVAWLLPNQDARYVLQGGVLAAGALVDWLRRTVVGNADGAVDAPPQSDRTQGPVMVLPALYGLGAPWFRSGARGVVAGLSVETMPGDIIRGALDGIGHLVADVVEAMLPALRATPASLRADGGLASDRYLMQRQADVLGLPVEIAKGESTALGIAGLAGIGAGVLPVDAIRAANPQIERFEPRSNAETRAAERAAWREFAASASRLAP